MTGSHVNTTATDAGPIGPRVRCRRAVVGDLAGIFEIYDHEITGGVATFETMVRTPEQRLEWWAAHPPERYPVMVAEDGAGGIIGWAALSSWSARPAYARTAESSVYVRSDWRGRGVGRSLMTALLAETLHGTGVRVVVARIVQPNPGSNRLHESLGFSRVGVLRRCGEKFGRILDVLLMDLQLDQASTGLS